MSTPQSPSERPGREAERGGRRADLPARREPDSPGRPRGPYGITEADIDLGPWVGAAEGETGPGAEFRREVDAVMRGLLVDMARAGVDIGRAAGGSPGSSPRRSRSPEPASELVVWGPRENTPLLLFRAADRMRDRLDGGRRAGRGRESVVRRDLLLLDASRPGGTSASRLQTRLRLPAASVSRLVQRCERRGLLERERLGNDRRALRITATAAGREVARQAAARWREADGALLATLAPSERDELRRLLRKAAGPAG